jgi:hypothetical protein
MDFTQGESPQSIRDAVAKVCSGFNDACWLNKDSEGGFPIISALRDLVPSKMRLMTNGGLI